MKTIKLTIGGITITIEGNGGSIKSNLHAGNTKSDYLYNAEIDVIESMVLAHAVNGINVESKEYLDGIQTTLDAIGNHS